MVDSDIATLIALDEGLLEKLLHEPLSSLTGESIFRAPPVPRIFCAFDVFWPAPTG